MYQVSYKLRTPFSKYENDCVFSYDLNTAKEVALEAANSRNVSNVKIIPHAINNRCEANLETHRLRELLAQAYRELQQLKKDYNSYIKKIHDPKLLLVVNVLEDEVVFYVKEKDNSVVEVKIPKEDFHSPACVLDFDDAEIIDDGLTVRFGQFECSVEHILEYQYQPEKFVDDEESS